MRRVVIDDTLPTGIRGFCAYFDGGCLPIPRYDHLPRHIKNRGELESQPGAVAFLSRRSKSNVAAI